MGSSGNININNNPIESYPNDENIKNTSKNSNIEHTSSIPSSSINNDSLQVSASENSIGVNNTRAATRTSVLAPSRLESRSVFSATESEGISKSMMDLVKSGVTTDMIVYNIAGSIMLDSAAIEEEEGLTAMNAVKISSEYVKPMADLTREEGKQTAAETRQQAKMSMAQGVSSLASGGLEIAGGIGAMSNAMSTAPESAGKGSASKITSEEEEAEGTAAGKRSSAARLEEEASSETRRGISRSQTQEETAASAQEKSVSQDNAKKIKEEDQTAKKNTDKTEEDTANKAAEGAQAEQKAVKEKESEFAKKHPKLKSALSAANTGLKMLASGNLIFVNAISRISDSAGRIATSSMQTKMADIQSQQADVRAEKQEEQMDFDLLQSSQNRLQTAAKNMGDVKDAVLQSVRDFNQASTQSVRGLFS